MLLRMHWRATCTNLSQLALSERAWTSLLPLKHTYSKSSKYQPNRQDLENIGSWNTLSVDYEKSAVGGRLIPKIDLFTVGAASIVNKRKSNEDRYLTKALLLPPSLDTTLLCVAVFDGHGGSLAAEFSSTVMAPVIEKNLQSDSDIERVLRKSFMDVNSAFADHVKRSGLDATRVSERYSGTTAVVCALVGGEHLYTAHVGDSRAVLCRLGGAYPLTHDHEPERADERRRVEAAGATLATNSLGQVLVEGKLSMTRSLGDLHLKRYGVIAEPDVSYVRVKHHKDAFVVLMTDGITFCVSNQEVVETVLSTASGSLQGQRGSAQQAAEAVMQRAVALRSNDNVTVVVLPLGMWGQMPAGGGGDGCVPFEFGRMLSGKFNDL